MKKYVLLSGILVCILFASCNKSIYYAWEGGEGSYCTLEVKKHQVIYRGTTSLLLQSWFGPTYIYLYGNEEPIYGDNFERKVVFIDINTVEARYCVLENRYVGEVPPPFRMGGFESTLDLFNNPDKRIAYVKEKDNPDTLYLAGGGLINDDYSRHLESSYINVQDSVLKSKGIVWFPPEMHRVKEIDYKKFGKRLQYINLKDPWKGTTNGNPKKIWFEDNVY